MGTSTDAWVGSALLDSDGRRLGTIEEMYRHAQTGLPQWVVVRLGRFGSRRSFVPLAAARRTSGGVVTPFPKSLIVAAPQVETDEELSEDDVIALYRHYDLPHDELVGDDPPRPPSARDRIIGYLNDSRGTTDL